MNEFLEPGQNVSKCDTVMHAITSKFNTTKDFVVEKIKSCTAVSFSTNIWTPYQMKIYMTITAHCISDKTMVDSGPLTWWQKNEERYPKLARAAKPLHSIPSMSKPSEHFFSKARFIVTKISSQKCRQTCVPFL